jgi:hypothetical protein
MTSHSGGIRLAVSGDTGFELDATSFSGEIRSDLALTGSSGQGERGRHHRSVRGVHGNGSAVLNIRTFSGAIDWGGASYLGVDIASDVIAAVRARHEKPNIRFQVGDITDDLPAADLLISKDVLQHLSNTLVHNFIENNLRKGKYKWVILTNDRGSKNSDVENGGYRAIDLSAPPFDVRGLVDLPIKFGNETTKITSLLDLTQPR